jgi:hypothetical protein
MLEIQCIGKSQNCLCQRFKRIFVIALFRDLGKAKPRKIGCNHSITVGQSRNQFAILKRRCREPVQEEDDWRIGTASLPIENGDAIGFHAIDGGKGHVDGFIRGLSQCRGNRASQCQETAAPLN